MSHIKVNNAEKILLFDGKCNLCTGLVRFVIERDSEGRIKFASLHSDKGKDYLKHFGLDDEQRGSFVLVEGDNCYLRSDAALRLFKSLDGL